MLLSEREKSQNVTTEQYEPKYLWGSPEGEVKLEKHEVSYSHQGLCQLAVGCWLGLLLSTRA